MPSPFYYRGVLNRLARLADSSNPPLVSLRAAIALATELSPANPRIDQVRQMLETANPIEYARHKLRDLYDLVDPAVPASEPLPTSEQGREAGCLTQEDEASEEDDDPL